jgi:hypothetical protein
MSIEAVVIVLIIVAQAVGLAGSLLLAVLPVTVVYAIAWLIMQVPLAMLEARAPREGRFREDSAVFTGAIGLVLCLVLTIWLCFAECDGITWQWAVSHFDFQGTWSSFLTIRWLSATALTAVVIEIVRTVMMAGRVRAAVADRRVFCAVRRPAAPDRKVRELMNRAKIAREKGRLRRSRRLYLSAFRRQTRASERQAG